MAIQVCEGPHGLVRVQSSSMSADEPSVRYLPREEDENDRVRIVRLERRHQEPLCEIGEWKVFVRAYPDRLEMVLVCENAGAARAA